MHGKKNPIWLVLALGIIGLLALTGNAGAQSLPRLKPLPPKKVRPAVTAQAHALAAPLESSQGSWQMLPNQPPVLDIADCGPGSPLLLTDGTVLVADNGCLDWWKLTPDEFGGYVNGTWTQIASTPADYRASVQRHVAGRRLWR